MFTQELADKIKHAVDSSDRNFWTAELHLQIIKYASEMKTLTGKEFCEQLGIPLSYVTILGGICTLIGTSTNLVVHGTFVPKSFYIE